MSRLSYAERVANGVTYLDATWGRDTWLATIDVDKLALDSTCNCVIGQAVRELGLPNHEWQPYLTYSDWYDLSYDPDEHDRRDVAELGFDVYDDGEAVHEEYAELEAEWKRRLRELKGIA